MKNLRDVFYAREKITFMVAFLHDATGRMVVLRR